MESLIISIIIILVKIIFVFMFQVALGVPIMTWVERRGAAMFQDRIGPNRVGPFGLLQAIADAIKAIFKEDWVPKNVNRLLFVMAPIISVTVALTTFAVIPFGEHTDFFGLLSTPTNLQVSNINLGVLYLFAMSSLGVYGIIIAGSSSNNKFSLAGALRASSQMISYELAMALSAASVFLLAGSVNLYDIVDGQKTIWYIFPAFIGFIVFIICMLAETNRNPFDLPEGESEIVAGYHLEYSSMKFASFMMAEYCNMITASGLIVTLFLGGWHPLPFLSWDKILELTNISKEFFNSYLFFLPMIVFFIKVAMALFCFVWIRWTLPRFRYDRLMTLGWKTLLPISIVNLIIVLGIVYVIDAGIL